MPMQGQDMDAMTVWKKNSAKSMPIFLEKLCSFTECSACNVRKRRNEGDSKELLSSQFCQKTSSLGFR